MQQIEYKKSYQEYKEELDAELNKTAEGFVRIGYLLKVARDTDILKESGYPTVTEFAKEEYGIDKSQVSRFIHINDKFAEGGYSDRLQEQYQGFGYAKLTLMLQLPDAVNETLSPAYSKAEIQTIKEEVDAEHQVTELERMMEAVEMQEPQKEEGSTLSSVIYYLGLYEPELYCAMAEVQNIKEMQETMAPAGERTYITRTPGMGKIMLMLSDSSDDVAIVNIRTGEKKSASWEEMYSEWQQLLDGDGSKEHWEKTYCREYPKKEPVAPVQQKKTVERSKKVVKSKPEKPVKGIKSESEPSMETVGEERDNTAGGSDKINSESQDKERAVGTESGLSESDAGTVGDGGEKRSEKQDAGNRQNGSSDICIENKIEEIASSESNGGINNYQIIEQIKSSIKSNASNVFRMIEEDGDVGDASHWRKISIRLNNLRCDIEEMIKYMEQEKEEEEEEEDDE